MGPDDFTQWKASELKAFLKGTVWRVGTNEKGVDYYYDKVKKKSQWVKPEEIAEFESSLTYDLFLIHQEAVGQPIAATDGTDVASHADNSASVADSATVLVPAATPAVAAQSIVAEPVPVKQPVPEKVYSREELVAILDSKDCILEPHVVARCRRLIKEHQEPSTVVMDKLIGNYTGYPMMAAAVLEWIKFAKVLEVFQNNKNLLNGNNTDFANTTAAASVAHYSSADCNGEIIAPLLADLVTQRFNRKLADSLVNVNAGSTGATSVPEVPAFVHEMVQNPTFNAALQDLHHDNQNSTLLKACCSGAYTVAHSEQEKQTVGGSGSAVRQLSQAEVVREDVRRFATIQDLLSKYTTASCKGDSAPAVDCKQQIVDLVARSSDAVKMFTLHLLAQQVRAINSHISGPVTPASYGTVGDPTGEGTSKKRLFNNEGETDYHQREAKAARNDAAYDHACTAALAAASTVLDGADALAELQSAVVAAANVTSFTAEYTTEDAEHSNSEASWQILTPAVERNEITTAEMEKLVCLVQDGSPFDMACLQHPAVQRQLADYLLLHNTASGSAGGDTARLLALGSSVGSAACATDPQPVEVSRLVECASRVLSTAELCQTVAEVFFGVIPCGTTESLRTIVHSCSASAVYVTRWCCHSASNASHRANLTFLPVLKLLVFLVRTAVEAHPLCYSHGVEACEAIFAASRTVLESAAFRSDQAAQESVMTLAATEVQKEVLEVMVTLVSLGCVHTPMQYFISSISTYDADLARHLLHCVLAGNTSALVSAAAHAALFVDLFHSDSAQRAVRSEHFAVEDRALLHIALTTSMHPAGLLSIKSQQRRGDLLQLLQQCGVR